MHMQNLVEFHQFAHKIMSRNEIDNNKTVGKIDVWQSHLVNINAYTKFSHLV